MSPKARTSYDLLLRLTDTNVCAAPNENETDFCTGRSKVSSGEDSRKTVVHSSWEKCNSLSLVRPNEITCLSSEIPTDSVSFKVVDSSRLISSNLTLSALYCGYHEDYQTCLAAAGKGVRGGNSIAHSVDVCRSLGKPPLSTKPCPFAAPWRSLARPRLRPAQVRASVLLTLRKLHTLLEKVKKVWAV